MECPSWKHPFREYAVNGAHQPVDQIRGSDAQRKHKQKNQHRIFRLVDQTFKDVQVKGHVKEPYIYRVLAQKQQYPRQDFVLLYKIKKYEEERRRKVYQDGVFFDTEKNA